MQVPHKHRAGRRYAALSTVANGQRPRPIPDRQMLRISSATRNGVFAQCRGVAACTVRRMHAFPEHPHKGTVTSLLHSRPFQRVELPSLVSSLTLMQPPKKTLQGMSSSNDCAYGSAVYASAPEQYEADYKQLCDLCDFYSTTPPPHGSTFFSTDLGGACKLRWERHTEAQTYTFIRTATEDDCMHPFAESSVAVSVIPKGWLAKLPGLVLANVHVAMLPAGPGDLAAIAPHFHRDGLVTGCAVDGGRFHVYSDWRTHSDGFGRIIVHGMPDDHTPNRRTAAGKVLQRLIDLDKYRALTLLALPFAQRKVMPRIDTLHRELQTVTSAMAGNASAETEQSTSARDTPSDTVQCYGLLQADELGSQRALLDRLCSLSAESLKLNSMSSYRFSASAAYARIVSDRIEFMQMERLDGVPSMATYIDGALHPAVRTCDAVAARLDRLRVQISAQADLLRTSLTVQQQAQSTKELEALQANSRTQLLLQESVEGLSVVAITYYTVGVVGYMAKGAQALGYLPVPVEVALGMSVPVVGAAVFVGLERMKAAVLGHGAKGKH